MVWSRVYIMKEVRWDEVGKGGGWAGRDGNVTISYARA